MRLTCLAVASAMLLCGQAGSAHAESEVGLWLEAGVKHKVNKKLRLGVGQHLRFENDVSEVASVMPELSLAYRLHKRLRLGMGYRYAYKRTASGDFDSRHRFHAEARATHKRGKIRLGYRVRFQDTLRGIDASDGSRYALRNKASVSRALNKKTTPELSVELFHAVGNGDTIKTDKLRFTGGVARDIGKHDVELFYRLEVLHEDPADPTMHIIGVAFHTSF